MKRYWFATICAAIVLIVNGVSIWQFEVGYSDKLIEEHRQTLRQFLIPSKSPPPPPIEGKDQEDLSSISFFVNEVPQRIKTHLKFDTDITQRRKERIDSLLNISLYLTIVATAFCVWLAGAGLCWWIRRMCNKGRLVLLLGILLGLCIMLSHFFTILRFPGEIFICLLWLPLLFGYLSGRSEKGHEVRAAIATCAFAALLVFVHFYYQLVTSYWEFNLHLLFGMGTLLGPDPYTPKDLIVLAGELFAGICALGIVGSYLALLEKKIRNRENQNG